MDLPDNPLDDLRREISCLTCVFFDGDYEDTGNEFAIVYCENGPMAANLESGCPHYVKDSCLDVIFMEKYRS